MRIYEKNKKLCGLCELCERKKGVGLEKKNWEALT